MMESTLKICNFTTAKLKQKLISYGSDASSNSDQPFEEARTHAAACRSAVPGSTCGILQKPPLAIQFHHQLLVSSVCMILTTKPRALTDQKQVLPSPPTTLGFIIFQPVFQTPAPTSVYCRTAFLLPTEVRCPSYPGRGRGKSKPCRMRRRRWAMAPRGPATLLDTPSLCGLAF